MSYAAPPGTYIERQGPIHRLDARVKLIVLLLATIALFARGTAAVLLGAGALAIAGIALAGISASSLVRAVKPCAVILLFVLVSKAVALDGTGEIALVGPLGIRPDGAARAALAVARIVILLGCALIVSASTTETELSDAVSWFMTPLAALGTPVTDIAMVLSIALRFIPVCMSEFDRIVAAQRARGARFNEGGIVQRVRRWGAVLIPLVVILFTHADQLADAMSDRCYGGAERTRMPHAVRMSDACVLLASCLLFVGVLILG